MSPAFTDYSEVTMANTRDRRSINPPIRFRYDLDSIDRDQSPCHPPVNNGSSTLPGPLDPFPRRTSSRPTYVLLAKRRITARVVAIAHHAVFLPSCLRPPQEGLILGPPHVVMPTLSIPRTCNPLFLTVVNSTFYEPTSARRADSI